MKNLSVISGLDYRYYDAMGLKIPATINPPSGNTRDNQPEPEAHQQNPPITEVNEAGKPAANTDGSGVPRGGDPAYRDLGPTLGYQGWRYV